MKKYVLSFVLMILVFVFSGCSDTEKDSIKDSSTGNTVSRVVTQLEDGDSTTKETNKPSIEQPAYLPVENNKEISDEININVGEYFIASGRRMVDRKEVSKKEFTEKYAFVLPEDFETANFYFDIPTEDGLEYYNEVENGYIRCLGKDRKSVLDVCICKTRYVDCGFISVTKAELKKTYINKTNLIITKNSAGEYRGEFEKNGYYYTFAMSRINEDLVISTLKNLTS